MLWVVFRSIFKAELPNYPLYLILGIVLWTFFADAVSATLPSIVARGTMLRDLVPADRHPGRGNRDGR